MSIQRFGGEIAGVLAGVLAGLINRPEDRHRARLPTITASPIGHVEMHERNIGKRGSSVQMRIAIEGRSPLANAGQPQ